MATLNGQMEVFWKKFGALIDSGVALLKALNVLAAEAPEGRMKEMINKVRKEIASGKTFGDALKNQPEYFPVMVVAMAENGETRGYLEQAALKIANGYKDGIFKADAGAQGETVKEKAEKVEVEQPGIVRITGSMIEDAFKKRASDIHLERMEKRGRIRYRIDGVLKESANPPSLELYDKIVSRIKIMAGMDVAEKRLPQDGRIMIEIAGKKLDLRVSTSPCIFGESVVVRILDKASAFVGLEEPWALYSGRILT